MTPGETILRDILPVPEICLQDSLQNTVLTRPYKELKNNAVEDFTLNYLYQLLEHTKGNVTLSARISGIKRQSLQKIIKRYGVQVDRYRS